MVNIIDYGFNLATIDIENLNGVIPARVTATHKERYEIVCEHGVTHARLKSSVYFNDSDENFPTTGDFVLAKYNSIGDCVITKTLDRKSLFSRKDPDKRPTEQAVAANFDYVFIMSSLNDDFNLNRIERYLTAAWQSGAVPVVILTKADLVDDYSEKLNSVEKLALGVGVFAVSAKTGQNMEMLSDYLKPRKTIVFLGSSGVGKSSLVNALSGEDLMGIGEIREDDSRGRHTTTHRQLIMLDNGVMLIDTPGMRELGMWDVSVGLGSAFADVEQYFGKCRFADCKHEKEPGCALKAAVQSGELSATRVKNYFSLMREALYYEDKQAYLRQQSKKFKSISKQLKNSKKK